MDSIKRMTKILPFLAAALLLCAPAFASITNKGNDAVQIKVHRKTGFSQSYTLYPDQSIAIPQESSKIELLPRGFGARGDEVINVVIVSVLGEETVLDGYGQIHELEKPEDAKEEEVIKLQYGKVVNAGNNNVDIEIKDDKGIINRRVLYPGQPFMLAPNVTEVKVIPTARLRGDEIIQVEALMPDGEEYTITRLGGVARTGQSAF